MLGVGISACTDMLDTGSDRYLMTEDNTLGSPNDAMYSVLGVLHQMRALGERYVLLGELRGDLVECTANAETDLLNIANFDVKAGDGNALATTRPYYEVINNCNYYLARADTNIVVQGNRVLLQEYAAMLTFRTWTYLQLALNFKEVTYITEPILTVADAGKEYPKYDMTKKGEIQKFAKRLIDDLQPYASVPTPDYGTIGSKQSSVLFIPAPLLLADLSLWAAESQEEYKNAAMRYYTYLTTRSNNVLGVDPAIAGGNGFMVWGDDIRESISMVIRGGGSSSYMGMYDTWPAEEMLTQMVFSMDYDGLKLISYSWPADGNYPFEYKIAPSRSGMDLFEKEPYYFYKENDDGSKTEARVPGGDIRGATYRPSMGMTMLGSYGTMQISNTDAVPVIWKYSGGDGFNTTNAPIALFRAQITWLHYAEALNHAGYPSLAFAVLKYGLNDVSLKDPDKVDPAETTPAPPPFADFRDTRFDYPTAVPLWAVVGNGIHKRGAGYAAQDPLYTISQEALDFNWGEQRYPGFPTQLATRQDTTDFVDAMIFKELTLESAFEGNRFSDLLRFADRRADPTFLAKWVGRKNPALEGKLQQRENWFLPVQ